MRAAPAVRQLGRRGTRVKAIDAGVGHGRRGCAALLLAVMAGVWSAGCSSGPGAPDDAKGTLQQVEDDRATKERFFRDLGNADNPMKSLSAEQRAHLLPLSYFPVDAEYSVPAQLIVSDEQPVFEMPTSKGLLRKERRVGILHFTLKGQALTLGAFIDDTTRDMTTLFVPFTDLTTGKETYAAGRYLDLHRTATGVYVIDFNQAYNPYCAYNATYDCPYPPPTNRLKVAVMAGEQVKPER